MTTGLKTIAAILLSGTVALLAATARAENFDLYQFDSVEQEARFDRLTQELRCPKCQNQTIGDSNAPIAKDLRQRTYELVKEGRSDDEIVAYLKERYGEFITYRPPFNAVTALLWTGPFLLLAIVAGILLVRLRRPAPPTAGNPPDAAQVREILARFEDRTDGEPRQ